jgi:hypothetical protein
MDEYMRHEPGLALSNSERLYQAFECHHGRNAFNSLGRDDRNFFEFFDEN